MVLELQGDAFTDGNGTASLELALRLAIATYTGKPTAKAHRKAERIQPSPSPKSATRKRGKITFNLNRGRHYVECLRCGKLFSQPIMDKADSEYCHNPANPYFGLCAKCDGHSGVSDVRLGGSLPTIRVPAEDITPTDYKLLDGDWAFYYSVAYRYSKKVEYQDRGDLCHDIILALAKAHVRDGKQLPELRAYRIASLIVALHWRKLYKGQKRVCLYDGLPKDQNCDQCKHKAGDPCAYRAVRPILSLESETIDDDGYIRQLKDTVADDNAIDLDVWLDRKAFLLGCPFRVIELADRKRTGKPLKQFEMNYLSRWRKKAQIRLV